MTELAPVRRLFEIGRVGVQGALGASYSRLDAGACADRHPGGRILRTEPLGTVGDLRYWVRIRVWARARDEVVISARGR
jgi:hypothetical protein